MKAAFCIPGDVQDLEDACLRLAALGYDGVEIWQQVLERLGLPAVQRAAEHAGIAVAQVCPYFDFVSGGPQYQRTMALVEEYVHIAAALNCPNIRVFTGPAGSREASAEQWEAAARGLQAACDLGRASGLTFVLELHPSSLMDTSASTLRLLQEVGRDNLQVNFQYPIPGEQLAESIAVLGPYTVHVHAHNWRSGQLTFLEDGELDVSWIIGTLKAQGFDGYISIEHPTHHPVWETAEREIAFLRRLISRLEGGAG